MHYSYTIVFVLLSLILGLMDGHPLSIMVLTMVVSLSGLSICYSNEKESRLYSCKLFGTVAIIYISSAYITSFAFHKNNNDFFIDCFSYIKDLDIRNLEVDPLLFIGLGYIEFQDLNVLHEIGYRLFIIFCNNYLDGASVFTLTYLHTSFGILSACVLFRVLYLFFGLDKAYKYTLTFTLLSHFFVYSIVILRDIVIAFFYLLCFDIILRKFKWIGVVKLIILIILTWGIRLYSGLFAFSFLFFYFFKKTQSSRYSRLFVCVYIGFISFIVINYVLNSEIFLQSSEELDRYVEFDTDRAQGFTSKISRLPVGIKEIVQSLYSQMNPFPFYDSLRHAHTMPLAFFNILRCITTLWWYFIFYGLCYALLVKRIIFKLNISELLLLCIIATFIVLNSVQIDVRRIMAIYPLVYLFYIKCKDKYLSIHSFSQINKILGRFYLFLLVIYIVLI